MIICSWKYYLLGKKYESRSNWNKAIDAYETAVRMFVENGNYDMASKVSSKLAFLYLLKVNYRQSARYQAKALLYAHFNNDSRRISSLLRELDMDSVNMFPELALVYDLVMQAKGEKENILEKHTVYDEGTNLISLTPRFPIHIDINELSQDSEIKDFEDLIVANRPKITGIANSFRYFNWANGEQIKAHNKIKIISNFTSWTSILISGLTNTECEHIENVEIKDVIPNEYQVTHIEYTEEQGTKRFTPDGTEYIWKINKLQQGDTIETTYYLMPRIYRTIIISENGVLKMYRQYGDIIRNDEKIYSKLEFKIPRADDVDYIIIEDIIPEQYDILEITPMMLGMEREQPAIGTALRYKITKNNVKHDLTITYTLDERKIIYRQTKKLVSKNKTYLNASLDIIEGKDDIKYWKFKITNPRTTKAFGIKGIINLPSKKYEILTDLENSEIHEQEAGTSIIWKVKEIEPEESVVLNGKMFSKTFTTISFDIMLEGWTPKKTKTNYTKYKERVYLDEFGIKEEEL